MPLIPPNLDDRRFDDLVAEAKRIIAQTCPEWTDLSPGDPGMVLVELFAHLTEVMLYRLNRLPDKAFIELLRLIGVRLQPPSAAGVTLRFTLARDAERRIEIPRGTRVAAGRSAGGAEAVVFATGRPASIEPGKRQVEVSAHHAELIEGEAAGTGTGLAGQWVTARRPPLIASTGDPLDLAVGVEAAPGELDERVPAVQHEGTAYRIWREVDSFVDVGADRFVYVADRASGTITFASAVRQLGDEGLEDIPRTLAEVPAAGRRIRLWYRRGGGPEGNVGAALLSTLKDPVPGVQVTNPEPAAGGRAAETLENALVRGPQELHSLRRAVTARDFELLALRSSGAVARARAFTLASLWTHAAPGTVEVLLVPDLPEDERPGGRVTAEALRARETEDARAPIQRALNLRRPLGTTCRVSWANYKTVRVKARVVAHREEDLAALQARVRARLYRTLSPLPGGSADGAERGRGRLLSTSGWRFGQALRASHVYDIVLAEPGVSYADQVLLEVDEVPDAAVSAITADASQPGTWYAGSGEALFRSVNDGEGWEASARFPGEEVERIASHPERPGLVAVATRQGGGSGLHVSDDCGEGWRVLARTAFRVVDLGWILRQGVPVLLMASDVGLYELALLPGATPVQVLVDPGNPNLGFYAVASSTSVRGETSVAVAAQATGGVFLSSQGAAAGTFRRVKGLEGEDVRVLAVQEQGVRSFLWAGVAVGSPSETGKGAFRLELRGAADSPEGWRAFGKGWKGGTCWGLAFQGAQVCAASHQAGVLRLDSAAADPAWLAPEIGCGLPLRDAGRLQPVRAVATAPDRALLMAGGPVGVCLSRDGAVRYERVSSRELADKVTLPETWLFCSGEHEITVVSEDEAARD
jgi:hypothetical protein